MQQNIHWLFAIAILCLAPSAFDIVRNGGPGLDGIAIGFSIGLSIALFSAGAVKRSRSNYENKLIPEKQLHPD